MNKEQFINELKKINISLNKEMLKKLDIYYHLLIQENKLYNLTTITDEKDVYLKHFYDSLCLAKAISLTNQSIIDIGTGAGFPGIVLKIAYPSLSVTLLDSTNKKCIFLKKVIDNLKLKNIKVVNARCEEYAKTNREQYDLVISRAVAPLKHLLEYSIPLLKVNGIFIALKGKLDEEMININNYYQKLDLVNPQIMQYELPIELSNRTIYTIRKNKSTNIRYPRSYKEIKKREI